MKYLILPLLIAGCISAPPQASSIEDYCAAVREESLVYKKAKDSGIDEMEVHLFVNWNYTDVYPEKEVRKMHVVIRLVYEGETPNKIWSRCIQERTNGTWFLGARS